MLLILTIVLTVIITGLLVYHLGFKYIYKKGYICRELKSRDYFVPADNGLHGLLICINTYQLNEKILLIYKDHIIREFNVNPEFGIFVTATGYDQEGNIISDKEYKELYKHTNLTNLLTFDDVNKFIKEQEKCY